jgi:hypothetical protein
MAGGALLPSNESFTLPTPRITQGRETRSTELSIAREIFVTKPRRTAPVVTGLLVLVVGILTALLLPSTAAAAKGTACGEQVLADWFDNGRVDRLYPLHCYEEAIDAIPADIRDYADAEEVISRALQGALEGELVPGGPDPSPDDRKVTPGTGGKGGKGGKGDGGTPVATPAVDTGGPSSVPIPLLVLGGMSLALLAAGGLGYWSRRRNATDSGDDELPDDHLN